MSISLSQSKTALAVNLTASFLGIGGTAPYTYSVRPGGAGGTINSSSGVYTAPSTVPSDPDLLFDIINVRDFVGATAQAQIMVGTPLLLFCEILQNQLNLPVGRVYLWDQKIMQPTDSGLYIAISVPSCKPFSNNVQPDPTLGWQSSIQYTNFNATLDIDVISRDSSARDRKEEIILALNSLYAQTQQEGNSFYIGKLPAGSRFLNLSMVDGAAIPYRYKVSVNMMYAVSKQNSASYFDTFQEDSLTINP